ncbi:MAG: hypothetical protein ACLQVX_22710 [Limisphaerales bacterium]
MRIYRDTSAAINAAVSTNVYRRLLTGQHVFEESTREESLDGLDKAQARNVQRARVYDYWHALVSQKAEAD